VARICEIKNFFLAVKILPTLGIHTKYKFLGIGIGVSFYNGDHMGGFAASVDQGKFNLKPEVNAGRGKS